LNQDGAADETGVIFPQTFGCRGCRRCVAPAMNQDQDITCPYRPYRSWGMIPVVLAAVIVFFTNLGGPLLWDDDEPKNAVCAREMLEREDWIVPTFNGNLRTDKPILLYWLTLLSYHLFGVSEFGARFASASLSVGTVLLSAQLGGMLFTSRAGIWAVIVLSTCFTFAMSARAATPDATLLFFSTAALTLFAAGWKSLSTQADTGLRVRAVIPLYIAMGLAVLAKGPVGFVLPVNAMGVFVLAVEMRRPFRPLELLNRVAGRLRRLHIIAGAAIVLAVAAPWYIIVGIETDWQWPLGFLEKHNVSRFLKPMEGHSGWIIYYVPAILIGTMPWSLPLVSALRDSISRMRSSREQHWADLFLMCWIGTYLVFFSLAKTKLPTYVLPCYPPLAVLIGRLIDGWISQAEGDRVRLWRSTYSGAVVLGLTVCIGGAIVGRILLQGEWHLVAVGLIPLIGSALAWRFLHVGRAGTSICAFATMAVLFHASLLGFAGTWISRHQVGERYVQLVREAGVEKWQLATLSYFRPGLAFYGNQPVEELHQPGEAVRYLRDNDSAFVVMREEHSAAVLKQLPGDVVVLDRSPAFLRANKYVVLIGRRKQSAVPEDDSVESIRQISSAPRTRGSISAN
jgi:4-amino-4-deoxy-L-arabinose transferase-like glycosyltransferase